MKKLPFLCLLWSVCFCFSLTFAAEVTVTSLSDTLITYADKAIASGTVSVDHLLTIMQTFHENQKTQVQSALEKWNQNTLQETLNQRSIMYPLTTHLYALKAGSGVAITNASGVTYTFKKQARLPRLNLSRGEEDYYSFPKYDTFLEMQRTTNQTWLLYNEISMHSGNQRYFPHYYYGGENTLHDVTWRDEGQQITEIKDTNTDFYYFFDLPAPVAETKTYTLTLTSGASLQGKDIYDAVSYSPDYFLTSLDKGFQFCQKVAAFIGENASNKEYPAQQCFDAAEGKFYKEMHEDILKYAADLYL